MNLNDRYWIRSGHNSDNANNKTLSKLNPFPDYISHPSFSRKQKQPFSQSDCWRPSTLLLIGYFCTHVPKMLCCDAVEFKSSRPINDRQNDRASILNLYETLVIEKAERDKATAAGEVCARILPPVFFLINLFNLGTCRPLNVSQRLRFRSFVSICCKLRRRKS